MTIAAVGATSAKADADPLVSLPTLGVGVLYTPALPPFLRTSLDSLDYLVVIPDMFWTDRGPGAVPRFAELDSWVDVLDWVSERRPLVAHNTGFSLGTAGSWVEDAYLEQIAAWHQRYRFAWHSDHLSFARVGGASGHDHNAGLAVPVPYDEDILDLIVDRVSRVRRRIPTPFLVENSVYYFVMPDQEMTEPQFLNRLTARTGCGLLLDIHNLYVNARNHGFDPLGFLGELDLSRVAEVHIAGGNELAGMYTDSHAGACPEPVWELLAHVVDHAPQLRGVTFEFHDSYFPLLQADGLRAQLDRARSVWARRH
jgi:uncharacterized protein (UPF0276 family)